MRRFLRTRIVLLFLVGVLPFSLMNLLSHSSAAEKASEKKIDALIADLGSDRFETREAATRELKERLDAIPALRRARRLADLEVRLRVEEILPVLERKRVSRCLTKVKALGKEGRAIEVADRLAYTANWGGIAVDEGWESLTQFADRIIVAMERCYDSSWGSLRNSHFPAGEFRRYDKLVEPKEIAKRKIEIDTGERDAPATEVKGRAGLLLLKETRGALLLRGETVSFLGEGYRSNVDCGMIAASGDVRLNGDSTLSVIIAGGNVKITHVLRGCILICDGDVEFSEAPEAPNLIIARGKVTYVKGKLTKSLVRSGHTLYVPGGKTIDRGDRMFYVPDVKTIDLTDGTPDPFAFVKFFELADVGLVAADDPSREKSTVGGVRLKEVCKTSPFASGLRDGDVVTAIEDKKTPTTEIFRRVLRRKLAEEEPAITFSIRRSGKTLDLPVAVKDR